MKTRLSILFLAVSTAASAVDQTWTGAVDSFWNTNGNWSGAATPGAADLAVFDATSAFNQATSLGADLSIRGLKITDVPAAVSIAAGNTLTTGSAGIDLSTATAGLTLNNPVTLSADQTWHTGTQTITTTAAATVSGTGILTKTGTGTLVLAGTNAFTAPVSVSQGQLTVKNGTGAGTHINTVTNVGTGTVNLANETTFRYERTSTNGTIFPNTFLAVAAGATAYLTTDNAGNGFNGSVSGAADSVFQIGRPGFLVQCSLAPGNLQQFANFNGTVRVFEAASLRFSPTTGLNNGGTNAIFEVNGFMNSRNGGTVTLGALTGSSAGNISGSTNGGIATYSVGQKNLNSIFSGILANGGTGGVNVLNFTKTGSGTQILTGNSTYTGDTTISGGVLQLGDGGTAGTLGTGKVNLSDPATILRVNRSGSVNLPGIISGSGSLEKLGAATLTLNAANTFSGSVLLQGGTVETAGLSAIGLPGGLGSGPVLTIDGGTLRYTGGATATDRAIILGSGGATLDASGTGALAFTSTAAPAFTGINTPSVLTLTGSSTAMNSFDAALANNGTGVVSLAKTGVGTWQLASASTISGPVALTAGTLVLGNTTGSATGTGPVTVGGTLAGTGTAGGTVSVGTGGIVSPGVNGIGNLTVGSLVLAAGSELSLGIASAASLDRVTVANAGGLTINGGGVRLRVDGSSNPWGTPGSYNLISYTGALTGNPSSLTVLNPVGGLTYTFGASGGFVTLAIANAGLPNTWNTDTSAIWGTAANWTTGIPGGIGGAVNFLGAITAPRTVTLDAPRTAGALKFDNPNAYTIAGTALLTLNNGASPASLIADTGHHLINAPLAVPANGLLSAAAGNASLTLGGVVSGSGLLTHTGAGTLGLGGTNSWSGGLAIQSGKVEINAAANLGTGPLVWTGNGTLSLTGDGVLTTNLSVAAGLTGTVETTGVNVTLNGSISGAGILAKAGDGTLTLGAINTHSGGIVLKGGLVSFTAPAQLGAGALTFQGGGLHYGAGNSDDTSLRSVTIAAGGATFDTGGNDVVFTSPIGNNGSGALTKTGAGRLSLMAANTYTGSTTVLGGSLAILSADDLGPAPLTNMPQQVALDGGSLVLDSTPVDFTATRGLAVGSAGGTIQVPGGFFLTLPGGIANRDAAAGILNLEGTGSVTLSGPGAFSGGGTFQSLTVNANATNALGTGPVRLEGTIINGGGGVNLDNGFIVENAATINMSNGSPGTVLLGPLTGGGSLTVNAPFVRGGISGNWTAFSGDLTITGNNECRLTGTTGFDNARVNLSGTSSLVLAVNPPNNGAFTRDLKIGQLTGTGQLGGQPVPGRFVNWHIGFLNTDSTFDGIIRDGMSQTIGTGLGAACLTKDGTGTLTLTGASTYTGTTTITGGTLLINGDNTLATGAIAVNGGTLGGSGKTGGSVTVQAAAFLSPGSGLGIFTAGNTVIEGTLVTEYNNGDAEPVDKLIVNGSLTLGAASHLALQSVGPFPAGAARVIATYSGTLTGTFATVTGLPPGYAVDYAYDDGITTGNIALVSGFNSPAYNAWASANGLTGSDALSGSDPDKDGLSNLLEFALDGNPASASDSGKTRAALTVVGPDNILTLTVPVRAGAVFGGTTSQSAAIDGLTHTIEGSDDLVVWNTMVISEITPAAAGGLPVLNAGWTYRTFRTPGAVNADSRDYLRVRVSPGS